MFLFLVIVFNLVAIHAIVQAKKEKEHDALILQMDSIDLIERQRLLNDSLLYPQPIPDTTKTDSTPCHR